MWNIDDSRRIIGQHPQYGPCRQGFKPFAGFENGQRAQKPEGVQSISNLGHAFRDRTKLKYCPDSNHEDVTEWPRDGSTFITYVQRHVRN